MHIHLPDRKRLIFDPQSVAVAAGCAIWRTLPRPTGLQPVYIVLSPSTQPTS
jgi:hypothetical protein